MTRSVTVWNDRCDNDLLLMSLLKIYQSDGGERGGINKRRLKTLPDDNKLVVDEE